MNYKKKLFQKYISCKVSTYVVYSRSWTRRVVVSNPRVGNLDFYLVFTWKSFTLDKNGNIGWMLCLYKIVLIQYSGNLSVTQYTTEMWCIVWQENKYVVQESWKALWLYKCCMTFIEEWGSTAIGSKINKPRQETLTTII